MSNEDIALKPLNVAQQDGQTDPTSAPSSDSNLDKLNDQMELGWNEVSQLLWKHELEQIKNWGDELNAFLIFAGLLAAVVTAFMIPFYTALQPESTPTSSTEVLIYLSKQLNSFALTSSFLNSTIPPYIPPLTAPSVKTVPQSTVNINALWVSALLCTLAAAFIAICVKQWLDHCIPRASAPRDSAIIWYLHRQDFTGWSVPAIMHLVPVLLEVSLVLFLVGLAILFWDLDEVVGSTAWALVSALLFFVLVTTAAPTFSRRCPYQSPQAWMLVYAKYCARRFFHKISHSSSDALKSLGTWNDYDRLSQSISSLQGLEDVALILKLDSAMRSRDERDLVMALYIEHASYKDAISTWQSIEKSSGHLRLRQVLLERIRKETDRNEQEKKAADLLLYMEKQKEEKEKKEKKEKKKKKKKKKEEEKKEKKEEVRKVVNVARVFEC